MAEEPALADPYMYGLGPDSAFEGETVDSKVWESDTIPGSPECLKAPTRSEGPIPSHAIPPSMGANSEPPNLERSVSWLFHWKMVLIPLVV